MRESDLLRLEAVCRAAGATLLAVRSYGLVGTMRACLGGAHCVVESKPDAQARASARKRPPAFPPLAAAAAAAKACPSSQATCSVRQTSPKPSLSLAKP